MAVEMIGGPRLCEPLLATGLGRFTGAASRQEAFRAVHGASGFVRRRAARGIRIGLGRFRLKKQEMEQLRLNHVVPFHAILRAGSRDG